MTTKTQPVHRIRYGAVVATIWPSLAGSFFNTTFRRTFRKPDETWSESDSFNDRDLPALAKAAFDAHSWIHAARTVNEAEGASGITEDADEVA